MTALRPVPLHAERSVPALEPIAAKVADVSDEELFPNIAEARRHAAALAAHAEIVGIDPALVEGR